MLRSKFKDDGELLEVTRGYRYRLRALYGVLVLSLLAFTVVLYNAQIVQGDAFYAQSASKIPVEEPVEASRGVITDRNGKVLVSNRQVHTITFDSSLLPEGTDQNDAILRLITLCEEHGVAWEDGLPITGRFPYSYTTAYASDTQRGRLSAFLADRGWTEAELTAEDPYPRFSAAAMEALGLPSDDLPAYRLLELMREDFAIDPALSMDVARKIIGVRYELAVRALLDAVPAYVFASDVSVELISILTDGRYAGVVVGASSVREYGTDSAAHILGRIGSIGPAEYDALIAQGYRGDDLVGTEGAEKAFEADLRGEDGKRVITTNEDGKITGELYTLEPEPGGTVALTIDIDFQAQVEAILAQAVADMNAAPPERDEDPEQHEKNDRERGAAAAVVQVGTGEILALASYPTYSLATYSQDLAQLSEDPASPLFNRALSAYAPGSTFKMVTAVAALESGVIAANTKIQTKGIYTYYGPGQYQPKCWLYRQGGGTHGRIDVSDAILHSCNYFFYEVGRITGIATLNEYAAAFGLGQPTGIELGERTGVLAGPEYSKSQGITWYDGNTLQAAIGQGDNLFTPLQLANYVATLAGGGDRYEAHLLKSVKSYDNTTLERLYDQGPVDRVEMSQETLAAVKEGMGDLVTRGNIAAYFEDCVVTAGAKTGSAQTGDDVAHGTFVCFAPFDDPEIAVALVIEKSGSGSLLASSAVQILNAWFSAGAGTAEVLSENTLLP